MLDLQTSLRGPKKLRKALLELGRAKVSERRNSLPWENVDGTQDVSECCKESESDKNTGQSKTQCPANVQSINQI